MSEPRLDPASPSIPTPRAVLGELAVAALAAAAATAWFFRSVVLSGFSAVPGDLADGRLLNYILEHGWLWLRGDALHRPLWQLPIFFPAGGGAFAYSDLMLSLAGPYWLARACGADPHTSFQIWHLAVGILNSLAAFALLRWGLGASRAGAVLGANLATFAASRLYQIHHAQLWPFFYPLLAVLAVAFHLRARSARGARWALAAAVAAVALQFYGAFYYAVFTLLLGGLALAVACFVRSLRPGLIARLRRDAMALGVAGCALLVLLAPLAIRYRRAEREVGRRHWKEVEPLLPRPASWIYLAPSAPLGGWTERAPIFVALPHRDEQAIGLGYLTTLLTLAGVAAGWRRPALFIASSAMAIAMLAITVYPGGITPWRLATAIVPGLSATRAMSRLGLALPLLAGAAMATLIEVSPRRFRPWLFGLALLAIAEQSVALTTFDKRVQQRWVAEIAALTDPAARAFAVSIRRPAFSPEIVQMDAMYAGLLAKRPTVNGYTGSRAPGWGGDLWLARSGRPDQRSAYEKALDDWLSAHGVARADVQWIELEPTYRRGRRYRPPRAQPH
jgi:hypothetical protein